MLPVAPLPQIYWITIWISVEVSKKQYLNFYGGRGVLANADLCWWSGAEWQNNNVHSLEYYCDIQCLCRGWSTLRGWRTGTRRTCCACRTTSAVKSAPISSASELTNVVSSCIKICIHCILYSDSVPCADNYLKKCDKNVAVDSSANARRARSGSGEARLESARWWTWWWWWWWCWTTWWWWWWWCWSTWSWCSWWSKTPR